jgi:hypothetical protein
MDQDVFGFITTEENNYKTNRVAITEGWEWNMYEHVNLSTLYKNSTYKTGKNDDKPFKNITRPLLNLQYRAEGFDVKDIILFINDAYEYYKSFLVRKYHEQWARENKIDTFIDELVESFVDYGGSLVKNVNQKRPELVPLQRLAFCDQTDILSGPVCEKHFYSISQLRDMAGKWDAQAIEDTIVLSQPFKKSQTMGDKAVKTPSKYIEVYELHGTFPEWWLNDNSDSDKLVGQLQIVTFYKNKEENKQGIVLFRGKEKDINDVYKFIPRDKIFGRALGLGGAEELFEAQVWTNYDIIRIKELLDHAAKMIYKTDDAAFAGRNTTTDLENGEIMVVAKGSDVSQLNTTAVNIPLFEKSIVEWQAFAKELAGASEAILGESPDSGTPFALQNLVVNQAQLLHEYRKGKLAVFVDEIYRDWILPYIVSEITKGKEFLAELDHEELMQVSESLVTCEVNKIIVEKILNGETIDPNQMDQLGQQIRQQFLKGGNKKFMEIFKGEMKEAPIDIEVSIAGKQKDLATIVQKLSNVFRQVFANPAILQDPNAVKVFNKILEYSGLEPIDIQPPQPQQNGPANKVSESISFKDLPPDGKVQMAKQAGITITPQAQATPAVPATVAQ